MDALIAVVKYLAVALAMFVVYAALYSCGVAPAENACRDRGGEPVVDRTWQVRCTEPAR